MTRLAAVLALAAALAGCAGGSSGHPAAVTVQGTIQTVGGPAPGAPRPIAGARFRLIGAGTSAAILADAHGHFDASLTPGTYRVQITGHAPMADGRPLPAVPSHVHVSSGSNAPIHLVVNIK